MPEQQKLYILYGYNNCYNTHNPTPIILGIYYSVENTFNRIMELCEKTGLRESFGTYYSGDGYWTYFINVAMFGDQYTKLFETKLTDVTMSSYTNTLSANSSGMTHKNFN